MFPEDEDWLIRHSEVRERDGEAVVTIPDEVLECSGLDLGDPVGLYTQDGGNVVVEAGSK
ncbi:hypothetical protein OB920_04995 [Halobacteria archaeon HArc-gm2]|nr:hypothetical protein [Halobacteria archaeon HArc-gm2]